VVDENEMLVQRTNVHGEFNENSRATWDIMRVLQRERNWGRLSSGQKHALYMVAHKMARIMAGDPNHPDHWDDISGYARCVSDRLRKPPEEWDPDNLYNVLARGRDSTPEEAEDWLRQAIQQQRLGAPAAPPEGRVAPAPAAPAPGLPRGRPARPTAVPQAAEEDRLAASVEQELNKNPL
jgi:hypothetical protein